MISDSAGAIVVSTWQEAEYLAAGHMQTLGFNDAAVTPAGADQGLDVVATGGAAQVKHFADSPIGAPVVQKLMGAAQGKRYQLFYALSGFSAAATKFAEKEKVALFTYDIFGAVQPVSSTAVFLQEYGFVVFDPSISTRARATMAEAVQQYAQSVGDTVGRFTEVASTVVISQFSERASRNDASESAILAQGLSEFQRELTLVVQLLVEIDGEQVHNLGKLMNQAATIEGMIYQMAVRYGIDFESIDGY